MPKPPKKTRVVNRRGGKPYDVNIARPSKWGNPFTHLKHSAERGLILVPSREEAVEEYRNYIIHERRDLMAQLRDIAQIQIEPPVIYRQRSFDFDGYVLPVFVADCYEPTLADMASIHAVLVQVQYNFDHLAARDCSNIHRC